MAYTTLQLINYAYYESRIVSREFETVSGTQAHDGLIFLNDIIQDKTIENGLIPYYEEFNFFADTGVGTYFIPDLITVDTFVFYIDTVRYETQPQGRRQFFGSSRAENIQSLPGAWHVERTFGGANLYIYFKPQQDFPMTIWGQFRLSEVAINQDLSLTLDRFYINYLKFNLAVRLCDEFNYTVPPGVMAQFKKYEDRISKQSGPLDLSMQKLSSLQRRGGLNYAQVNIGKGWTN